MDKSAPGKFPTLISFSQALPKLKTTGIYTRAKFAQDHPEMVRDYLRAVLTVYRSIRENPKSLYDALRKHVKMDAATAKLVGDAYIEREIWDVNGGLTTEDVKYSLDFFTQMGSVPTGLDAAKITDLTYLDAVVQQLGQK